MPTCICCILAATFDFSTAYPTSCFVASSIIFYVYMSIPYTATVPFAFFVSKRFTSDVSSPFVISVCIDCTMLPFIVVPSFVLMDCVFIVVSFYILSTSERMK